MPHHPQQERAIVVATNHPLFFVLILLINASKYQPPSSEHEHDQLKLCKEFYGGAPHHWLKPGLWWYIQDIQVVLRENLPTGDGLTGGKMLQGKLSLPDFATVHPFQPSPGSTSSS